MASTPATAFSLSPAISSCAARAAVFSRDVGACHLPRHSCGRGGAVKVARAQNAGAAGASGDGDGDGVVSRRAAMALQILAGGGWGLLTNVGVAGASDGSAAESRPQFYELDGSGGVKALDIRQGVGSAPRMGDKVAIHYYARLAAKQGWRFDSTYDHKDETGTPVPYEFIVGSGMVIAGLDSAVRTMKEGGVRRVVIPPSQGYQNMTQGPIPPNYFDRQRLYTTIFNPTRLANGEGSTLGTLIFDVELLAIRSV